MDGMAGPAGPQGEKGDKGDPGEAADPAVLAALQADIDALETAVAALDTGKADTPDPVGLPSLTGAAALTRDVTILSQKANTYDVSNLSITATAASSAAKGSYAGKAMTGFGGLDVTAAGSTGANIRGNWLKYGHWGIISTLSDSMAVFSVGEATGANPAPRPGEVSATWSGSMVGSWDEAARQATQSEIDAENMHLITKLSTSGETIGQQVPAQLDGVTDPDTDDRQGINLPGMSVRGTARLTVNFSQTASGAEAAASLAIGGLTGDRGTFRPGVMQVDPETPGDDTPLVADPNSLMVWTGMKITAGDFARQDFNRNAGPDGIYVGSSPTANDNIGDDIHDRGAGATRYLAGRFYGTDGMEVGGVFMENGQVSGSDNAFGASPTASGTVDADPDHAMDIAGTLTGAFGAARVIP
jgi:hypothetical protein